jgi:hypothetical protein
VHLLLAADDVTALKKEQRLKSRTVDGDIDSEEQQDPHQSDRAGAKRRARLSLTSQQQVLLFHGEIDPSVEFDEEEKEDAHCNFLHKSDPESVVANKLRRFHRHYHKGAINLRGISNGRGIRDGQDWRTTDLDADQDSIANPGVRQVAIVWTRDARIEHSSDPCSDCKALVDIDPTLECAASCSDRSSDKANSTIEFIFFLVSITFIFHTATHS